MYRRLIVIVLGILLMTNLKANIQVTTHQGKLEGFETEDSFAYLGIPYAAAPVGDLRWRAPQSAPTWKGLRSAKDYGPDCAQAPFPPDAAPIRTAPSEDCLYLNVWQPKATEQGKLQPVMVWIHGGGFVNGGASPAVYSGERFARDGIVLVSINYRLARFGFFAHPLLVDEGYGGNFGFLDQIAGLEWVQSNIEQFGGDPNRVTIFGESAGGMSVHALLQSPLARGLFQQAIIQSGGGRERTLPTPSLAQGATIGAQFINELGVSVSTASELRALPTESIVAGLNMMTMGSQTLSGPMIDGQTLLGSPIDAASAGLHAPVPVMIGANSADGFPFIQDKSKVFSSFGNLESQARALYDPDGTTSGMIVATATSADAMMIEPARAVARTLADKQPVWLYRFGYAVPQFAKAMGGAPHATEIPYAFDTVDFRKGLNLPEMIPEEAPVARLMHQYWVNFARTGDPNGAEVPTWPKATATTDDVQVLDGQGARHSPDPLKQRLDFVMGRAAPQ